MSNIFEIVYNGNYNEFIKYIEKVPSYKYIVDNEGYGLIHRACESKDPRILRVLILLNFDVNMKHPIFGLTPLHIAVSIQNYEILLMLIKLGADINIKDSFNQTPIDLYYSLYYNTDKLDKKIENKINYNTKFRLKNRFAVFVENVLLNKNIDILKHRIPNSKISL